MKALGCSSALVWGHEAELQEWMPLDESGICLLLWSMVIIMVYGYRMTITNSGENERELWTIHSIKTQLETPQQTLPVLHLPHFFNFFTSKIDNLKNQLYLGLPSSTYLHHCLIPFTILSHDHCHIHWSLKASSLHPTQIFQPWLHPHFTD